MDNNGEQSEEERKNKIVENFKKRMFKKIEKKIPINVKLNMGANDIMMRFDKITLKYCQKIFEKKEQEAGEGLNLTEFVKMILKYTPHEEPEKPDLIHVALSIFQEVDINGDGGMEWNEFVQYLIDKVKSTTIKEGKDPISGAPMTIHEQIQYLKDNSY